MKVTIMNYIIPDGSSPGLTRTSGLSLVGTCEESSAMRHVPKNSIIQEKDKTRR